MSNLETNSHKKNSEKGMTTVDKIYSLAEQNIYEFPDTVEKNVLLQT